MAKTKKKSASKSPSKKVAKPSKTVKKAAKPAKPAKAGKALKAASKATPKLKKAAAKETVKTAKKSKAEADSKKVAKSTAVKDIAAPKAMNKDKVAKAPVEKARKPEKDRDVEEFEDELEEDVLSYGEAIRLTAEDLEDPEELVLTDAEGRRYCKVKDCDQLSIVEGFCRLHYLALWKKIQIRKKILTDGKLEKYIEELTSRYPDKYIEMIRRDLKTEKDFLSVIQELEIDDSADNDFEEDSSFAEEIRGMGTSRGSEGGSDEF